MKKIFPLIILALFFLSCSHRIIRSGYNSDNSIKEIGEVVIMKNAIIPDSIATKVGSIRIGDSGFSTSCNEADGLGILVKEAGFADADIVVITREQRPDVVSSCYRCSADFYKYNSPFYYSLYSTDEEYKEIYVDSRVIKDKKNVVGMILGGIAGAVLGILLANALFY